MYENAYKKVTKNERWQYVADCHSKQSHSSFIKLNLIQNVLIFQLHYQVHLVWIKNYKHMSRHKYE